MSKATIPKKNTSDNDRVMTPPRVAKQIINHFKPSGYYLDPCVGDGAFIQEYSLYAQHRSRCRGIRGCEIDRNDDFMIFDPYLDYFRERNMRRITFDWIVSNPPYSKLSDWLEKSFQVADNVVYLVQQPAPFFTKRLRLAEEAGFGLKEMYRLDCPVEWQRRGLSFGTGLCAFHWQRGYEGGLSITDGRKKP